MEVPENFVDFGNTSLCESPVSLHQSNVYKLTGPSI